MENVISDFQEIFASPTSAIPQIAIPLLGLVFVILAFRKKISSGVTFFENNLPAFDSGWKSVFYFIAAYLLASIIIIITLGVGLFIANIGRPEPLILSFFETIVIVPIIYILTYCIWKLLKKKEKSPSSYNTHRLSIFKSIPKAFYYYFVISFFCFIAHFAFLAIVDLLNTRGLHITLAEQDILLEIQKLQSPLKVGIVLFFCIVLIPIAEELIFRVGLYRFLKSKMNFSLAILFSSFIFAAIHWNLQATPGLIILAIGLCYAYEKTGNIKVPIFIHMINNLFAFGLVYLA